MDKKKLIFEDNYIRGWKIDKTNKELKKVEPKPFNVNDTERMYELRSYTYNPGLVSILFIVKQNKKSKMFIGRISLKHENFGTDVIEDFVCETFKDLERKKEFLESFISKMPMSKIFGNPVLFVLDANYFEELGSKISKQESIDGKENTVKVEKSNVKKNKSKK